MKEELILKYDSPEINELKVKIALDRGINLPDYFLDYLNDDIFYNIFINMDIFLPKTQDFINRYESRISSLKDIVVRSINNKNTFEKLALFNSPKVCKYVLKFKNEISEKVFIDYLTRYVITHPTSYKNIYMLVTGWINVKIYDDKDTIILVRLKRFISRLETLGISNCVIGNIIRSFYMTHRYDEFLLCDGPLLIQNYYNKYDGEFVSFVPFGQKYDKYNVRIYITRENPKLITELPDSLIDDMLYYVSRVDYDYGHKSYMIIELIDAICNGSYNNIKIIAPYANEYCTKDELKRIIDAVCDGKKDNEEFTQIEALLKVYRAYKDNPESSFTYEMIIRLLRSGVKPKYMTKFVKIDTIISPILTYCHKYDIIDIMSQDLLMYSKNTNLVHDNSLMRLNDYIISDCISRMHNKAYNSMLEIIFSPNVWDVLTFKSKMTVLNSVDILECVKHYPHIINYIQVRDRINICDIERMYNIHPHFVTYTYTGSTVAYSKLVNMVNLIGYVKIQGDFNLTGELVGKLLDLDIGFGYILDLPTNIQKNRVIEYYLNKNRIS